MWFFIRWKFFAFSVPSTQPPIQPPTQPPTHPPLKKHTPKQIEPINAAHPPLSVPTISKIHQKLTYTTIPRWQRDLTQFVTVIPVYWTDYENQNMALSALM